MNEQTFFTLGQAAKVTGRSKATLSNAIKSGRLSVHEKTEHGYQIAASELFRAFPPEQANGALNGSTEQTLTEDKPGINRALNRELELLREERERERHHLERTVRQLEGTIDDLRADRDHWRQQATALLTGPRPIQGRRVRWPLVLGGVVLAALLAAAGAWLYLDPWFP